MSDEALVAWTRGDPREQKPAGQIVEGQIGDLSKTWTISREEFQDPVLSKDLCFRYNIHMAAIRYATKERASIEIYGRSGNFIAQLKNVSVTGACLEWIEDDVTLEKGDLVRMTVVLRALNRRHNLNGEVVWRDGKMTGINFIRSNEVIEKMMERN